MSQHRRRPNAARLLAAACFALALTASPMRGADSRGSPSSAAASPPHSFDMFCGPRCVQFVLRHYGRDCELMPLIDEVQASDWDDGSSLESVQAALERRGVHCQAVRLGADAALAWNGPAIVHLRPQSEDTLGHFVVHLPSSDPDQCPLWCGLAGVRTVSRVELMELASGAVLLTFRDPIRPETAALSALAYRRPGRYWPLLAIAAGVASIFVAVVFPRPSRFILLRKEQA